MTYAIKLHSLAEKELEESYQWYEERSAGLGKRFMTEVNKRLERISLSPLSYAKKQNNYREVLVDTFPFTIVYEVYEKQKVVFVSYIFHTKRNPLQKYKR